MARPAESRMEALQEQTLKRPLGLNKPIWYEEFLGNPDLFYRTYYIPKTELGKQLDRGYVLPYPKSRIPHSEIHKWRKISAPVDILKEAQSNIAHALYNRSPSPFDYCVRGRNRYMAMGKHANRSIIIAMDIKDAFPSTTRDMVMKTLTDERFSEDDAELICNIGTHHNSLPQGSPASPILLNLCRKKLDYRLAGYVKKRYDGELTVYVDNYFISSNRGDMNKGIVAFKEIARQEGYDLNNKKIYIMRKGSRMSGLGLVVSHKPIAIADTAAHPDAVTRSLGYGYSAGIWGERFDSFIPVVQPTKKERDRIRATLHQAEKRLDNGEQTQPGFNLMRIKGLIETCNGSVYYQRFRDQMARIESKMN